ncbi:MAG: dihydropteroate synthase [Endomicrobium sp.]|jgi:dihydropteroate synthase|nr:dihydropteroate synthase [Endomicrobium sp.]
MIIKKITVNNFKDVLKLVGNIGCDVNVCRSLAEKGIVELISIEKIDNRAANILKQEAISVGADSVVNENVSKFKRGLSNTVLLATINQIRKLIDKIKLQPFGLKKIALKLNNITLNEKKIFKYGNKYIDLSNTVVMGIINMDPCSFSGDGFFNSDKALRRAIEFEKFGAKMIDIGAESSRPGSNRINAKTEIKRLIPVLKKIKRSISIPISIDTYKYETAKAVLNEGADIINDIFALRKGKEKLARLVADTKAGLILMHMRGTPKNMQISPYYKNCIYEIYQFLVKRKKYATDFGILEESIAVDPGPGFGKSLEHNIELIKNIKIFSNIGVVVGAVSRKKFVKTITNCTDKASFVVANFFTALSGADILRVHDVKETINALKIIKIFKEK